MCFVPDCNCKAFWLRNIFIATATKAHLFCYDQRQQHFKTLKIILHQRFTTRQNGCRENCNGVNWYISARVKPTDGVACNSACWVARGQEPISLWWHPTSLNLRLALGINKRNLHKMKNFCFKLLELHCRSIQGPLQIIFYCFCRFSSALKLQLQLADH